MKSEQKQQNHLVWLGVKILVVAVQLVMSVILAISIWRIGILADFVTALVTVVLVVFVVLNVVCLFVLKKARLWVQIVGVVLAMGVIVVAGVALRYVGALDTFFDKVTEKEPEIKEYSVLVLKESESKKIEDLDSKSVGFLKTDLYAGLAEEKLAEIIKIEAGNYEDVAIMSDMMNNELLDAMVIEVSRVEAMEEEAPGMFDDKEVIYNFVIEIPDEGGATEFKEITEEPFLVYISGIDSRNGFQDASLSDVNIVVAVNPKDGKMLLASIPRDTYVQLHGTTGRKDKLTHAGWYGIGMSKSTIEDLLDIEIDYTIKVSFGAVVKIVDELGGIEIYSDTAMNLKVEGADKRCNYIVGKQWVDGDCALRFARERKTYQTGDIHRGENQQAILTSIIDKMTSSKDYFLRLPEMLDAASDYMATSLSQDDIAKFIRLQLSEQTKWQIESIMLEGEPDRLPTYSMGENYILYVMHPYADSIRELHDKINEYLSS